MAWPFLYLTLAEVGAAAHGLPWRGAVKPQGIEPMGTSNHTHFSRRGMIAAAGALPLLAACGPGRAAGKENTAAMAGPGRAGDVEIVSSRAAGRFDSDAAFEVLGEGYGWSEGPTWDRARGALYFTDVPGNVAYRWAEGEGVSEWLNPSGGTVVEGFREPGANGLWYARDGSLLICNHGARALERMDIGTKARTTLAERFGGERFNSPNDVVEGPDGTLYFSDPPYGLEDEDESPLKEMAVNGVYRLSPDGALERILDDMTRPNGVALSPDGAKLYIAQSDPEMPILREYDVATGAVRQLFDFKPFMDADNPGLPDGFAVAGNGDIFVTGPNGVFLLDPEGELLARIHTGSATANCCFGGADGSTLFITAHNRLLRIDTDYTGVQWT